MSGRASRVHGKIGLLKLEELACELITSKPGEDYAGWDLLLEEDSVQGTPYEKRCHPAYQKYFVQVKTVQRGGESHKRKREKYLLDHCVRASKDFNAWFIFVAVEHANKVEEVFLIHLHERLIRKTALILAEDENPEGIWIRWTDDDKIDPLDADSFLRKLRFYVGKDPHLYASRKISIGSECGLPPPSGRESGIPEQEDGEDRKVMGETPIDLHMRLTPRGSSQHQAVDLTICRTIAAPSGVAMSIAIDRLPRLALR